MKANAVAEWQGDSIYFFKPAKNTEMVGVRWKSRLRHDKDKGEEGEKRKERSGGNAAVSRTHEKMV